MTVVARQFHLKARPEGLPASDNFELVERSLACPHTGQVLVRNRWLSVDPYMRGRMTGRESYMPPFELGEPLDGAAIGVVIESEDTDLRPGDVVSHFAGWRDYAVIDATSATKIDPAIPEQAYLGPLGFPGFAAYIGLLRIGKPQSGETVFVSAAAGSVGSLAVQIAKIKGCRVVASAGSEEKLRWLRDEAGVDAAINYKEAEDMSAALDAAAPEGIDVYFDNVGGEILDIALAQLAMHARVVICGAISQYNATEGVKGPANYLSLLVNRARMQGMVVFDYAARYGEAAREMGGWLADGRLQSREDIVEGFDTFPDALLKLFRGENTGKLLLKIG